MSIVERAMSVSSQQREFLPEGMDELVARMNRMEVADDAELEQQILAQNVFDGRQIDPLIEKKLDPDEIEVIKFSVRFPDGNKIVSLRYIVDDAYQPYFVSVSHADMN